MVGLFFSAVRGHVAKKDRNFKPTEQYLDSAGRKRFKGTKFLAGVNTLKFRMCYLYLLYILGKQTCRTRAGSTHGSSPDVL